LLRDIEKLIRQSIPTTDRRSASAQYHRPDAHGRAPANGKHAPSKRSRQPHNNTGNNGIPTFRQRLIPEIRRNKLGMLLPALPASRSCNVLLIRVAPARLTIWVGIARKADNGKGKIMQFEAS
jgi:hypothetical protein